jgi:hypothetical protein
LGPEGDRSHDRAGHAVLMLGSVDQGQQASPTVTDEKCWQPELFGLSDADRNGKFRHHVVKFADCCAWSVRVTVATLIEGVDGVAGARKVGCQAIVAASMVAQAVGDLDDGTGRRSGQPRLAVQQRAASATNEIVAYFPRDIRQAHAAPPIRAIDSISTGLPSGSAATPTAERLCRPAGA